MSKNLTDDFVQDISPSDNNSHGKHASKKVKETHDSDKRGKKATRHGRKKGRQKDVVTRLMWGSRIGGLSRRWLAPQMEFHVEQDGSSVMREGWN